jgi:hypothetical protein
MSVPQLTSGSLRSARVRARIPRVVAMVFVVLLSATGLRVILSGPQQAPAARTVVAPSGDQGATSFAEAFTRAYLTWDGDDPDARAAQLKPFLGSDLDADGGLQAATGQSQSVSWTAVLGDRREGERRLVTVMAQTSSGVTYLSVPVQRNRRGFLAIAGYPAIVGPPAVDAQQQQPAEDEVQDDALKTVVTRALTNYLAANQRNLLADLTPDAVVSLPSAALKLRQVDAVTWVKPRRRVAVQLTAQDDHGTTWTLRYELDVLHRDRWYVRSLQVNPTFQGGS